LFELQIKGLWAPRIPQITLFSNPKGGGY